MPLLTLSEIKSKQETTKTLRLGEDHIGATTFKQIKKYVNQDKVDFKKCILKDSKEDYLIFEGQLPKLWYYKEVKVSCVIFNYGTGTNQRQFLMKLHLPKGEDAYAQIGTLSKWQNNYFFESSTKAISFKDNNLLFSSIDYAANKLNGQLPFLENFYPQNKEIKVGLNGYKIITKKEAFDFYYFLFEEPASTPSIANGSMDASGLLFWEYGGLNFLIEKEVNKKISLPGFQIILNKMGIWMPLEYESSGPNINWEGKIKINKTIELQIAGSLDPYNNVLAASFRDFPTLLDILKMTQEKTHFPKFFDSLLSVKLSSLEMLFNLNRKKIEGVGLSLTTENKIELLPKIISIKPSFDLEIYYTTKDIEDFIDGEIVNTTITYKSVKGLLVGEFILGTKRFETSINYPELEVEAKMAAGEALSIHDLKGNLLPSKAPLPDISITALSVSFNLNERDYIVMNGSGKYRFNEREITLNLGILKLGDSTTIIGGFIYRFKNLDFKAEIEFDKTDWIVAAYFEGEVSLKTIGESLSFSPPEELGIVTFNTIKLFFSSQTEDPTTSSKQKKFSFKAHSIYKWELGKKAGQVAFNHFFLDVDYLGSDSTTDKSGSSKGTIDTQIQIGSKIFVDLKATLKSTSTEKGLLFEGSVDMTDDLESVVTDIQTAFEVNKKELVPDFLTAWQLKTLSITFNTHNKDFEFVFALTNTAAPGLDLSFTLSLLHKKDKSYTAKFEGIALYQTEKIDIAFDLLIQKQVQETPPKKTVSIIGNYKANKPPKLSDVLAAVAAHHQMEVVLPAEMMIDAAATGFGVSLKKVDDQPFAAQLAGAFNLIVKQTTPLDFYFAFSNEVAADTAFTEPLYAKTKNGAPRVPKPAIVFGMSMGGVVDLSKLPVVGSIPGMKTLGIDKLGFYYTNAQLSDKQQVNFRVPQITGKTQLPPSNGNGQIPSPSNVNTSNGQTNSPIKETNSTTAFLDRSGFTLMALFGKIEQNGSTKLKPIGSLALPLGEGQPKSDASSSPNAPAPLKPSIPVKWININKTLGPVSIQKVGLNYKEGQASVGFSAGMALGPFSLDLEELAITFPMPLPGKPAGSKVAFDLKGMSLDIRTGSLQISGAFLKAATNKGTPSYYGQVIVKVGTFGLKALGGYAPASKQMPASFFIYANVELPLGGPPYLYITGFAGGFGVNNQLRLPTLQELPTFILLPSNAPKQTGSVSGTMKSVLPRLQKTFTPKKGQYWVAAGINFSSFEMIKAFAAVTVSFGVDFEIALLGQCSMSFPTMVDKPVAYVEIAIMASFSESSGLLAVQGILNPASYIFGDFCRIQGGFAFYIWFNPPKRANGPRAGEFLVTLGGYHPSFRRPAYYPIVPRLGIQFNLGAIQIVGRCYFALTPSMFMAGGYWKATYGIKRVNAWFTIDVNFLIEWAPFQYEATVYVRLGCEIDLWLFTIKPSIGANLLIWGPPLGGVATIDLGIFAFDIKFGKSQTLPPPIGWQDFKESFLPADVKRDRKTKSRSTRATKRNIRSRAQKETITALLVSSISQGLNGTEVNELDWVLDSDNFVIRVTSAIPINASYWGSEKINRSFPNLLLSKNNPESFAANLNASIHIKPMRLNNVTSRLTIHLSKRDDNGKYAIVNEVGVTPILSDIPTALWGEPTGAKVKANDKAILPSYLSGFDIKPLPRTPRSVKAVPLVQLIYNQGKEYFFHFHRPAISILQLSKTIEFKRKLKGKSGTGSRMTINIQRKGNNASGGILSLTNTNHRLESLLEESIEANRNNILQNLQEIGFETITTAQLTTFATKTILRDWPEVMVIGSDFE